MNGVFVDTHYFVASINRTDQWHARAVEVETVLKGAKFVTTESVLIELLNYVSNYSAEVRSNVAQVVRDILVDPNTETVLHTHQLFLDGLQLYESRLDKGYSLTDCISMTVMRERGISQVLTHDKHFAQEGFDILL